uniref:DUF262 domain-containing protein n=1 Tax=uncultured marine thaumarchaeote KM3_67_B11 TaxID=1456234 RepID=A0A075HJ60_9ARCH|nr:hypothetical protein, containing DUF2081 domain [uncultured marine thaumarchaeote KM3_67_B11]
MNKNRDVATYDVGHLNIDSILHWLKRDEIDIPELQRPFVWTPKKIWEFIEALYHGHPIGFFVTYDKPSIPLKGGKKAKSGSKIIIDGQQRIKALQSVVLQGKPIINEKWKEINPKVAFNPQNEDNQFAISSNRHKKNPKWIDDIGPIIDHPSNVMPAITNYMAENKKADKKKVENAIWQLSTIGQRVIGEIVIRNDTDSGTVAQIFVDINSKNTVLKKADYIGAMISSVDDKQGPSVRKCFDNFSRLLQNPAQYKEVANDKQFAKDGFLKKISWLAKKKHKPIYKPDYEDVLNVVGQLKFNIIKLDVILDLLKGWNTKKKQYETSISRQTLKKLEAGVLEVSNEYNFLSFEEILKGIGFVDYSILQKNKGAALNFVYAVYLKLKNKLPDRKLAMIIGKWFVMSLLTSRYSGAGYANLQTDLDFIEKNNIEKALDDIEKDKLRQDFWDSDLVIDLTKSSSYRANSTLAVLHAAMINDGTRGFLSKDIKTFQLFQDKGQIHHIFPQDFLKKKGFVKREINQFANLVPTTTKINGHIKNKPPKTYLDEVREGVKKGKPEFYGFIDDKSLKTNFEQNCIPEDITKMTERQYETFLKQRRKLMAKKIEKYYKNL